MAAGSVMEKIFLSAGVPESDNAEYGATADPMLIHSAIRSLCRLVFGHKYLIWGGHPAITPMMWAACENLGVNYAQAVHLYQSRFYTQEQYPEENRRFANVTYVRPGRDEDESLRLMRERIMADHEFEAAVFIGGKKGVEQEYELFTSRQPKSKAIVLTATGGGAQCIAQRNKEVHIAPLDMIDFFTFLADRIDISMSRPGNVSPSHPS